MPAFIDITGKRFGRLTVLHRAGWKGKAIMWACRCDCGKLHDVNGQALRDGHSQSCGCLHHEGIADRNRTHGLSDSPEYRNWAAMLTRCTNPESQDYPNYGGRGITVCERWKSFENFYADMGPRPGPAHTVDRKDNNGNYEPANCRWATPRQQARNRRNNALVTYQDETLLLTEWARRKGICRYTLWSRYKKGETGDRLFRKPKFCGASRARPQPSPSLQVPA